VTQVAAKTDDRLFMTARGGYELLSPMRQDFDHSRHSSSNDPHQYLIVTHTKSFIGSRGEMSIDRRTYHSVTGRPWLKLRAVNPTRQGWEEFSVARIITTARNIKRDKRQDTNGQN
jgi:hypothetical protein